MVKFLIVLGCVALALAAVTFGPTWVAALTHNKELANEVALSSTKDIGRTIIVCIIGGGIIAATLVYFSRFLK